MEILTFSQAADVFEVSSATISRWVKTGKLKEGRKAGKQKTVTQESVDALKSDAAFQIARESAQNKQSSKSKVTQLYANEEMEELKQRIEKLEKLVEDLSKELEKIRKDTESNTKNNEGGINTIRKDSKNNTKKQQIAQRKKGGEK